MTQAELAQLRFLNSSTLPNWQSVQFSVAKKLDDSIPYIGKIQITSTTGGKHAPGSMHYQGLAIDFVLKGGQRLWYVFNWLRQLGWLRVGIMKYANGFHVDTGKEAGKATGPYLFAEDIKGNDLGPLTSQPSSYMAGIPGYGTEVPAIALQPGFGGASATYAGAPGDTGSAPATPGTAGPGPALAILVPAVIIGLKIMGA